MSHASPSSGSQILTIGTFAEETQTTFSIPSGKILLAQWTSRSPKGEGFGGAITFCEEFGNHADAFQLLPLGGNANIHWHRLVSRVQRVGSVSLVLRTIRVIRAEQVPGRPKQVHSDVMARPFIVEEFLQFVHQFLPVLLDILCR